MVPTRPFEEPPAALPVVGVAEAVAGGVGVAVSVAGGVLLGAELGFVVCLGLVGVTEWPLSGAVRCAVPVA